MKDQINQLNQDTPIALSARPAYLCADAVPVCGENFDAVWCAERGLPATACRLQAIWLPDASRVSLLLPLSDAFCPANLALIPAIDAHSVMRVLRHSFADCVYVLSDDERDTSAPRVVDVSTYTYLCQLIDRATVLGALAARPPIPIADRQALSRYMIGAARDISHFLGLEIPGADLRIFPVSYPYAGMLFPMTLYRMLLLLALGVLHGFSGETRARVRIELDEELLVPRLCIPAGNKTPLPQEWEQCRRLSAAAGAYFKVQRHRDAILVRFCPLCPHIPPEDFYVFRAGVEPEQF